MTDTDETGDDRSHCPSCGSSGLDGQGNFRREQAAIREDGRMVNHVERWYQMHCSDCGQVFAVLESVGDVFPGDAHMHHEQ